MTPPASPPWKELPAMSQKPAVLGKKPSLWITERRLAMAFGALSLEDPQSEMSADEAATFIRQYVNEDSAIGQRDRIAEFILDSKDLLDAKQKRHEAEIEQLRSLIAKVELHIIAVMFERDVAELRGHERVIRMRETPGSVEIEDEKLIPEAFYTAAKSDLYDCVEALATLGLDLCDKLRRQADPSDDYDDARQHAQDGYLRIADIRRKAALLVRRLDRQAIQQTWKDTGDDTSVPGVRKRVDLKLQIR